MSPSTPDNEPRLPPGQFEVEHWPVVDQRIPTKVDAGAWELEVISASGAIKLWNLDDLVGLGVEERVVDLHAVTTWSRLGLTVSGVDLTKLLEAPPPGAAGLLEFTGYDGFRATLPLAALSQETLCIVHRAEGRPLAREHGGPARLLAPHRYAWKSVKWLKRVAVVPVDQVGQRERLGYHGNADPWLEERFSE